MTLGCALLLGTGFLACHVIPSLLGFGVFLRWPPPPSGFAFSANPSAILHVKENPSSKSTIYFFLPCPPIAPAAAPIAACSAISAFSSASFSSRLMFVSRNAKSFLRSEEHTSELQSLR